MTAAGADDARRGSASAPTNLAAVVAAVVRAATASKSKRQWYAPHLAAFAAWSHERGWRPGTERLLQMDRIERYIAIGMTDAADSTRATRRSILRRMALKLSPDLRDAPDHEAIAYRRVPPPYRPTEVAGFVRCVTAQPTPGRRRSLAAILYLGLGCCLDTRDLGWVGGGDVVRDEHGVQVTVHGRLPPRTVIAQATTRTGSSR